MDIYKEATKRCLRFLTGKGAVSVEELWGVPLDWLNLLYARLREELTNLHEAGADLTDRFRKTPANENLKREKTIEELALKIQILEDIAQTRVSAKEELDAAARKAEQRRQLQTLLLEKEYDSLKEMSVEDIKKMLDEL